MPTLLQIANEFAALDQLLEERNGDISDPDVQAIINEWMLTLQSDLEEKCDGYAAYIRQLELLAAARKEESERLALSASRLTTNANYLKNRLKEALIAIGAKKVTGQHRTVTVCGNGGKQPFVIHEGVEIPAAYMYQPPPIPDSDKIREALTANCKLDFAHLEPRGTHLRIS